MHQDAWRRQIQARQVIDAETLDYGYASLSSRTSAEEGLVHWKTAEAIAERLPRVYKISRAPGGDRRIRNIRKGDETL